MRFCYTSYQEREHAHQMGIEQEQELSELTGRYYTILGRRHCRHGFKAAIEQKEYLNGYSRQYVKENIPF